ncbi:MAG TPA: hypothetical protein VK859_00100, partial [bacterium]|nr:hypothetical protein [bacterium]
MEPQRPWFSPGLSFRAYLNQYPLVFLLSFLCAFGWVVHWAPASCFTEASVVLKRLPGYSPWVYTFLWGIALFAFLHLMAVSPLFQKLKHRVVVYVFGIGALYLFYH